MANKRGAEREHQRSHDLSVLHRVAQAPHPGLAEQPDQRQDHDDTEHDPGGRADEREGARPPDCGRGHRVAGHGATGS